MPINPVDRLLTDDDLIAMFTEPALIPVRSALAFMLDEGLDHRPIQPVVVQTHVYITTVQEQGLAGERSDFRLLAHARKIGCTFLVGDKAFRFLHRRLRNLGLSHAGIVYMPAKRPSQYLTDWIIASYERSLELDAPDMLHHEYWKV